MSDNHRQAAKKLKAPDTFQQSVLKVLDVLTKNSTIVVISVAVVLVIAAAIGGAQYYMNHKSDGRRVELAKIDAVNMSEMDGVNKQREGIQKTVAELQSKLPKGKDAEKSAEYQQLQAQIKAEQNKIEAFQPDHSKSLQMYGEFYKKYADTPEGWAAGMRVAAHHLEKREFDAARPILDDIYAKSKNSVLYQIQSGMSLIAVLEDKNEYDQALSKIDTMMKTLPDQMQARLLLAKARMQLAKNTPAEAKTTLDGIMKDHSGTPEADQARGMKALLN